jgi:2'-hydroxyisoflavone reductase
LKHPQGFRSLTISLGASTAGGIQQGAGLDKRPAGGQPTRELGRTLPTRSDDLRVLVLGGTLFLGRYIVEAALARRHEVVLFNRGQRNPHLFPEIEKLRGDRDRDVSALRGRRFEAVIDTSGYRPKQVRVVTDVLGGTIDHYTFISTISVYRAFPPRRSFDEDAPLAEGDQGYGALKARCEEALAETLQGRLACVRPGLIVGPHDPTDRFTYWPRRVARGGDVLAPGRPVRAVQLVDVRDLAEWCLQLAEHTRVGVFNAVGPRSTLTMGRLLEDCAAVTKSSAHFIWMPDEDLLAAGIKPWTELPLWIPESDPRMGGMLLADNSRAVAAGLTFRPLSDTIEATLEWDRREGAARYDLPIRVTPIGPEREAELLAHCA